MPKKREEWGDQWQTHKLCKTLIMRQKVEMGPGTTVVNCRTIFRGLSSSKGVGSGKRMPRVGKKNADMFTPGLTNPHKSEGAAHVRSQKSKKDRVKWRQ